MKETMLMERLIVERLQANERRAGSFDCSGDDAWQVSSGEI